MSYTHVGAVSGSKKGIGLAIVRNLALQYPSSFDSRDRNRGEEAIQKIYEDADMRRRKVLDRDRSGSVTVKFLSA